MPTDNGDARAAQESGTSGANDDDLKLRESELRIELPDCADADRMKKALVKAGEDPGRAHKHAHHRLTTPAIVRRALATLSLRTPRNAGGYVATLMDDLTARAKQVEAQRRQQASEAMQFRTGEADTRIDAMSESELEEVIGSVGWARGMKASKLRSDPVLRKHLAETMAGRLESEASDGDAATSMGGR